MTLSRAACTLLAASLIATPLAAREIAFRVEARTVHSYEIEICDPEVELIADGDDDTDLDYRITDSTGAVVHEDKGGTDRAAARLVNLKSAGCTAYDLEVTNLGNVFNLMKVTLGAPSGATSDDGRDRRVTFENKRDEAIYFLRWSRGEEPRWGEDRLGDEVIMGGGSWTGTVDDGGNACVYDFKIETASDEVVMRMDVDVCEARRIVID
ncbi:hypothetical protein [Sphingomicrobium arenosum]|uniref:hypothetical protein n=1 Tax=Sphingomicrobium arenosum TaxID=2233861 RepID=UPI002240EC03|nr:hypothetical protein [Sphingomicrobium arenosum]